MRAPLSSSTTIKSALGIFALGLISVAVLSACGGGDAVTTSSTSTTTTTPTTYLTSSGTVSAPFAPVGGRLRYLLQGPRKNLAGVDSVALDDANGTAGTVTQVSGALTTIGTSTLTGTLAVQAIKGDANYAQGRWTRGTATLPGGVTALTGANQLAFHYLAVNDLTALPAVAPGGALTCSNLRQTGASYIGTAGTAPSDTTTMGVAAAQASVTFPAGLMTVKVAVTVFTPGYESKVAPEDTFTFATVGATQAFTVSPGVGAYTLPSDGNMIVLGDNGAGGVILGVAYRITMNDAGQSGSHYQGIISMDCTL